MASVMTSSPIEVWILISIIGAGSMLGMYYALAARIRDEIAVHDLKLRATKLRADYLHRLESMRAGLGDPGADCGVDILPEEPEAPTAVAIRKAA